MTAATKHHTGKEFLRDLFDLEGKVAVVIGGTGVLCGTMAWGLWRAGCRVVLVGRNRGKAESHFQQWGSPPDEARFFKSDVTHRDQVETIVPAVTQWFGRIDIWINGAAINPSIPYFDITDEEFDNILDANLKTVHMACQIIGKHWIDNGQKGCHQHDLNGGCPPFKPSICIQPQQSPSFEPDVKLNPRMGRPWDSSQRPPFRFLSRTTEPKSSGRIKSKGHYGPHPHGTLW